MKCDITVTVCGLKKLDVTSFIAVFLSDLFLVGHMKWVKEIFERYNFIQSYPKEKKVFLFATTP